MITGGLNFVYAAYALTVSALAGLALVVLARSLYWARRARELEKR
jgi:hypothetical protein